MNRKLSIQLVTYILPLLLILPIFTSTVQSIPPVAQNILIVDINGNGEYTSIKDAINDATTTDVIEIKQGIYKENNLIINKKLTITAEDFVNTIVDFGGETGFILSSTHVEISNLKLTNAGQYAIKIESESNSCTISNCIIDKYGADTGIFIGASYVTISNCNISGIDSTGVGISILKTSNIVKGCTIQGFGTGIMVLVNSYDNKILNCNIINNQVGVDIRINSNENTVSECNIYSNTKGIYIWQNSNNNRIYMNNFWKNDINALDESSNIWDNGATGNYWDSYRGDDNNNDGIGDTSYIISAENEDRYPIMIMILPDVITLPTNIRQTTSMANEKPSFTWTPSVYSKDIKGYYVKIDENKETFIGDTTIWTSPTNVSDGPHVFYIRAETIDSTSSRYATLVFYIYTTISPSLIDSDKDGLPDIEENELGSSLNNPRDAKKIYPGGKPYFLVDVNQDNSFDVLYNPTTKTTTAIEKSGNNYLIEVNGDKEWDYIYNTADGSLSTYREEATQTLNIWTIIILGLTLTILIVISIIGWHYIKNSRTRPKYVKTEEYKKPEITTVKTSEMKKPLTKIPTTERRYTVEMMNETRALIQKIEQDFAEYVENLRQLDEQIDETPKETEKEVIYRETKKVETKDLEDIESEIDKISEELSKE